MPSPDDDLGLEPDSSEFTFDPVERAEAARQLELKDADRRTQQEQILRQRKNAFTRVFRDGGASKDDIAIAIAVLRRFCRWRTSTFHADARLHAVAEGRREVLLLVDDYCELSIDELLNKLA